MFKPPVYVPLLMVSVPQLSSIEEPVLPAVAVRPSNVAVPLFWMPDKLSKQIAWMQKNGYAFSCTSYTQIDESGAPTGKTIESIPKTNYNRLLLDCPVGNSSVVYDVEKIGKFEVPNIRKRNDDALWLQMLKKEPYIWGMPEVLMKYRIRKNSISSNKLKVVKYHWILYREIEHLSVARSAFHICYWGIIKILHIK